MDRTPGRNVEARGTLTTLGCRSMVRRAASPERRSLTVAGVPPGSGWRDVAGRPGAGMVDGSRRRSLDWGRDREEPP